ncbi:hypothetical protein DERF_003742 [Dermatophagoides farinae]|uniref:Uncharacterized protein n=1 Tax=Dermatophagoides farinae TaxID=6954 RepID=A0A922LDN3_DERFA|nr:hypothetical protein DERF_003742 [Dermatophagoides farinae]
MEICISGAAAAATATVIVTEFQIHNIKRKRKIFIDDVVVVAIGFLPDVVKLLTNGRLELLAKTNSNNSSSDMAEISAESRIDKCILAKCTRYSLRDEIGVAQNAHFICK